uniref:BSD domain-containing protein n=1 Tax=Araucaria cunninghamii TaxID=56994 RepID=A0A0D6R2W4_ARACU
MNFFKAAFFDSGEEKNSEDVGNPEKDATDGWENDGGDWPAHEEIGPSERTTERETLPQNSGWNFGGLVKVLTSKSEEVIEAYRRDLEEFRTGLQKETEAIREVASRAVKDLPNSLEVGASVAQGSLETVGQAIDELGSSVWRGTQEILAEGKELIQKLDEENAATNDQAESSVVYSNVGVHKYSRFEAQVRAMQLDSNTYCREPEDFEDFEAWKAGFRLEERAEEIEVICSENGFMEEIKSRLVPNFVDYETFWTRHFYRLHKLKQAEEARADLVKRAIISQEEDEDLSWEVDDEEETEVKEENKTEDAEINTKIGEKSWKKIDMVENSVEELAARQEIPEENVGKREIVEEIVEEPYEMARESKPNENVAEKPKDGVDLVQETQAEEASDEKSKVDEGDDDQTFMEAKADPAESSKSSDFSVVSSRPSSHDEDDLGWDEIEDLSGIDEKKFATGGSPRRADIRKRISAIEDEEDLSWDVDDDEDVKS